MTTCLNMLCTIALLTYIQIPSDISFGIYLSLPLQSLLVPTPFTKGGGGSRADPSAISKTFAPMNVKFCRELDTPSKVFEMLKVFT